MPSKKINVKISEVLVERNEFQQKGLNLPHVSLTKEGVVPKSERYERDFLVKDEEKDYKMTRVGDLCYNPANLKFGVITLNEKINGIFSPIYVTFEINNKLMTNLYAKYFFIRHNFLSKLMRYQQGTVYERMAVSPEDFVRDNINIHTLSEQEKIGSFLSAIDRLIEKQKEKVARIKSLKKGHLQKMFPNNEEKNPKLRIKNFSQDWGLDYLGNLASFKKGKGYSKADICNEGTPLILYGRLYTKYETLISEVETFSEKKKSCLLSKGGEVLVPGSGETSEEIARASVLGKSGFIIGGDLNIIETKKLIEPYFLALLITFGKSHIKLVKKAQGKSIVHLHSRDFYDIPVSFPSLEEQRKISFFFAKIDSYINILEKKVTSIENFKKFYLQRIFAV
jgi:type I restriction enzyme S subunit